MQPIWLQESRRIVDSIDLLSLAGLLPHFRPCDDTLGNSRFQIFKQLDSFSLNLYA